MKELAGKTAYIIFIAVVVMLVVGALFWSNNCAENFSKDYCDFQKQHHAGMF